MKHKLIFIIIVVSVLINSTANIEASNKKLIEISDDNGVWTTTANIDLFNKIYTNNNAITIHANDNVIAPGSYNTYTFRIKNIANQSIDYKLHIEVKYNPTGISIPIVTRIKENNGRWVIGDEKRYVNIDELNDIKENVCLNQNGYTYYTVEWKWPIASDDDEHDTYLGNLSCDDNVDISLLLSVSANLKNTKTPDTGDIHSTALYIFLICISIIGLFSMCYNKHHE